MCVCGDWLQCVLLAEDVGCQPISAVVDWIDALKSYAMEEGASSLSPRCALSMHTTSMCDVDVCVDGGGVGAAGAGGVAVPPAWVRDKDGAAQLVKPLRKAVVSLLIAEAKALKWYHVTTWTRWWSGCEPSRRTAVCSVWCA